MKALIAAVHGIMAGATEVTWPEQFQAWMFRRDPEVHVITNRYSEWPLPRVNWFKNRILARRLANQVELSAEHCPIWFVAHSNGTCVSLLAAKLLIERGHRVAGMILTGGACEADLTKNGVLDWWRDGWLGAAVAYSSPDDAIVAGDASAATEWYWKVRDWIWGGLMWPYGCLGRTGWLWRGQPFTANAEGLLQMTGDIRGLDGTIFTRWYEGGHNAYYRKERINCTFEQIYQDLLQPRKANGRGAK